MHIKPTLSPPYPKTRPAVLLLASTLAAGLAFVAPGSASAKEASPGQTTEPQALAAERVERFMTILSLPDAEKAADLESFLAPEFQLVRANGARFDKAEYVADPSSVAAYEITDLVATVADDVIVASYTLNVTATIDGVEQTTVAPRLSVFHRGDGGWQLAAHSNFAALDPS